MQALTNTQKDLLAKILSESGPDSARVNALRFRASHEDALVDLDTLELDRLIERIGNKYFLRLLALCEMQAQNKDADHALFLCGHLFTFLRLLYKEDPERNITLDHLAKTADLPLSDVRTALSYLTQAPIWGSYTNLSAAEAFVMPSENILKYKTFENVIEQLRKSSRQNRSPADAREKQQKFGILDSPISLASDLAKPSGVLGRAVIFLDVDDFKAINTQLTEVVVDDLILSPIHNLLASCVEHLGYAYGQGGDEFTILLTNSSEAMALDFAEALRTQIEGLRFAGAALTIHLTASIGIAHGTSGEDGKDLPKRANLAEGHAKKNGRNCVAVWANDQCRVVRSGTHASKPTIDVVAPPCPIRQEELAVLLHLSRLNTVVPLNHVAAELQVSPSKAKYILEQLEGRKLIDVFHNYAYGTKYGLGRRGRRYLAENNLLK